MGIVVEGKGLTKHFGEGDAKVVAVDQVDIAIEESELVMFMGDSGCGKTTLISLLGCILTPSEGDVWIDGEQIDYENHDLSQLRSKQIGFVFQLFNLIPYLTALENVMVAMDIAGMKGNEAEKYAAELLTQVGLEQRLHHRPAQLSGGEKQRVSFARALANNPKIIFADEPTANLDSRQRRESDELGSRAARRTPDHNRNRNASRGLKKRCGSSGSDEGWADCVGVVRLS